MFRHLSKKDIPFLLLSFVLPLLLFILTSSSSLMFDDAAEFSVVIKQGSIAHPPGTPAFIFFGMLWTKLTSLAGMPIITSLNLFASLCISISSLLLYIILAGVSQRLDVATSYRVICCSVALSFATAATTWAWANTIEVYSFQVLAMSVALLGLTSYQLNRSRSGLFVAAFGIAAGLAGHHLTMIVFLPFTLFFFTPGLFVPVVIKTEKKSDKKPEKKSDKKKQQKEESKSLLTQLFAVFREKNFWILAGSVAVLTIFFYGWMFARAQNEYPFMFGQPGTIDELIYHIRGGSYGKNLTSASSDIISSRLPYFLKLTSAELFLMLPFFILGLAVLAAKKLGKLLWLIVIYYLVIFIYQLNNNQWSSTDAYMLLPFLVLYIAVFYAAVFHINKFKLQYVLPILVVIQVAFNFKDHDRRSYPVSKSLMELLDKSAPKNSVILISDWTTCIQYYYYRIVENFRPDLVVLNYDIKFTHYRILPVLYPEFYKRIQPEYDRFIDELRKTHPHQVTNTGCDLSTPELTNTFKAVLAKMETVTQEDSTYFLTDPRAHHFFSQQQLYDPRRYVNGGFSSSRPGVNEANDFFIELNLPFLNSPLLYNDPAALDKLVDFQAMLDRHIEFYQLNNDQPRFAKAEMAKSRVLRMQRDMRKSMSFAYKVK